MKVSTLTQNQYLKAEDLRNRTHVVRIARATLEQVGNKDAPKICLAFEGKSKKLALNKTNAATLAAALGDESDEWRGAEITLQAMMVQFQGKPVLGIQAYVTPEQQAAFKPYKGPVGDESDDDDIPF